MNDITIRLLALYDYLKDAKRVSSKADFAQKLEISNSTITDITKGRTNAGINVVRNIVVAFPDINTDWVLAGVGSMLKMSEKIVYTLDHNPRVEGFSDVDIEDSLPAKTPKLSPTKGEKLSPTLSPTPKNCKICDEKDAVIAEQRARILDLKEYIELLKDQVPGQKKSVG